MSVTAPVAASAAAPAAPRARFGIPSFLPRVRTVRVGLLGLGTVGQGLVALLERQHDELARRHGLRFEVERVLVRHASKPRAFAPRAGEITADRGAFLAGTYDVVVEALGGVADAGHLVETFLARRVPVVTANKALLAERAAELDLLARSAGAVLRYEASVAAGIPLIGLLERALQSTAVTRLEAVLNGTSHFVLDRIERDGVPFADALAEARRLGLAEADARLDTSGFDAAQKLGVLVWTLSGRSLHWTRLEIEGIEGVRGVDHQAARALGGRLKPVAVAGLDGGATGGAFVGPAFVADAHPLASLVHAQNGIRLVGDTIEDLYLSGPGAGGTPTAAAILDDLLAVFGEQARRPAPARTPAAPIEDLAAPTTPWLLVADAPAHRSVPLERAVAAVGADLVRVVDLAGTTTRAAIVGPTDRRVVRRIAARLTKSGFRVRAYRALALPNTHPTKS